LTYTPDILEDIMLDAKLGLSLLDISIRLDIPYNQFYADFCNAETQIKLYYDAGRSQGRIETDKALFDLAKNGSTSAKLSYDNKLTEADLKNKFIEILNS